MPGRYYRYALDDVCVVQIHDGWDHHAPAHDYFGTNVDDLTFDEECISLGTSPAEFDFPVTMTLIESGGKRVLVDAGLGHPARRTAVVCRKAWRRWALNRTAWMWW